MTAYADIDIDQDYEDDSAAIKHYFLVSYNTVTGEWEIDDDAVFFPDTPIYDPSVQRMRKVGSIDEIEIDSQLRSALKDVLGDIAAVDVDE